MANDAGPKLGKGDRIRITQGPAEGVTGTIFWKGQNKYGPGDRYGVRGDDGETHWIDGASVEATDAAVPEGPTFERGDRVRFRVQGQEGTGTVFWTGQNRHGPGQRLGVNPDGAEGRDDALWLDARAARPLSPDEDPQGGQADWGGGRREEPYGGGRRGGGRGSGGGGGGSYGGGGSSSWDDGPADIPSEYQGNVSMDEMPPAAPWDDGAADAMAAHTDDEDEGPPLEW